MNYVELKTILDFHAKWLKGEPDGKKADLHGSDLSGSDLSGTKLSGANLIRANLSGADLRRADLRRTNLIMANLSGADLSGANLGGANFGSANLIRANLSGANLSKANLSKANLNGAENINYPIACPEKGSFIAFKSAKGFIVELMVPEDAMRSSATSRKCRCSKAKVMSITKPDGSDSGITSIPSGFDSKFIYTVGETVEVEDFDTNRWNECAPGIHFFITRQEAVDY